jgi:hypothetical protein
MRGRFLAWLFCCAMTPEEIAEAREEIITAELAADGVTSMSDGTRSVSKDPDVAKKRLDLLDRLDTRTSTQPHFGLRFTKLVPPGGG